MPRYQNELTSTILLIGGKYRIAPKGSTNPYTYERTDFADILDADMNHVGVQQFIASKKIIPFDGAVIAAAKPVAAARVVAPKVEKVPDLTASITGEPMTSTETVATKSEPAATFAELGHALAEAIAPAAAQAFAVAEVLSQPEPQLSKKERRRAAAAATSTTEESK